MQLGTLEKESGQIYCRYYQAHIIREQAWFFVAIVRSYEHVMFDRTLDAHTSTFEFFVPVDMENYFLTIMAVLVDQGIVKNLQSYENRLLDPMQIV